MRLRNFRLLLPSAVVQYQLYDDDNDSLGFTINKWSSGKGVLAANRAFGRNFFQWLQTLSSFWRPNSWIRLISSKYSTWNECKSLYFWNAVNYIDVDTSWDKRLQTRKSTCNAPFMHRWTYCGYFTHSNDNLFSGVDYVPFYWGHERNSLRLESKVNFSTGLFMWGLDHMHHACDTWPVFWTCGSDLPNNGEIVIIENAHDTTSTLTPTMRLTTTLLL
jgi:hypothetical protein